MSASIVPAIRQSALKLGALVLCLSLMPTATHALDLHVPSTDGQALRNDTGELRALENRLQRQRFQERQQQFREQERLSLQPPKAPTVPVIKPGCKLRVYGNIRVCR